MYMKQIDFLETFVDGHFTNATNVFDFGFGNG